MKLTEEKTREALECCGVHEDRCHECPLNNLVTCKEQLIKNVHRLVEEITDEKDRYKRYYFNHCFDELRANVEADVKADTVRKMQTEIEARCIKGGIYPAFVKSTVNQIAEELVKGNE